MMKNKKEIEADELGLPYMSYEKESTKMLIQSGFRVREERKNEKEN